MSCIICHKNDFITVSTVDSKNKSFLKVVFCKNCGLVQQNPIPSEKEVNEYYEKDYRKDYKKTFTPKLKHIYRAGNLAIERINFLKERNFLSGSLLDVGAGGGEFTYLSGKLGFMSEGIEPNVGYSNFAKKEYGVNIKTGNLDDVQKKFDLITMFHALEHIPNPIKTFKSLYELLNKDGILFIEVPNIETKGASPHNIYFKAHILYFSTSTLTSAASKYFEKIDEDVGTNIRIIFKRKDVVGEKTYLPSLDQVNKTASRLQEKGWLEYLFYGGGFKKLPSRLLKIFFESRLNYKSSIQVLDDILSGIIK